MDKQYYFTLKISKHSTKALDTDIRFIFYMDYVNRTNNLSLLKLFHKFDIGLLVKKAQSLANLFSRLKNESSDAVVCYSLIIIHQE